MSFSTFGVSRAKRLGHLLRCLIYFRQMSRHVATFDLFLQGKCHFQMSRHLRQGQLAHMPPAHAGGHWLAAQQGHWVRWFEASSAPLEAVEDAEQLGDPRRKRTSGQPSKLGGLSLGKSQIYGQDRHAERLSGHMYALRSRDRGCKRGGGGPRTREKSTAPSRVERDTPKIRCPEQKNQPTLLILVVARNHPRPPVHVVQSERRMSFQSCALYSRMLSHGILIMGSTSRAGGLRQI